MAMLVLVLLVLISPISNGKVIDINIHGLGESGQEARVLSFDTEQGDVQDSVKRSCAGIF